jgi:RNA polymerase sigma factor (sigma-70 family)
MRNTAAQCDAARQFLEHYDELLAWAMRLTGRGVDEAQDLVHDAFIAFTGGTRADIHNLNGYLYGILRNILRADRRRADYRRRAAGPTGESNLETFHQPAIEPIDRLHAERTLARVASFARRRSYESKVGSALLLRYFLGYAPREIARIMRVQTSNVDDWLKLGRREARRINDNEPSAVPQVAENSSVVRPFTLPASRVPSGATNTLAGLRREVFRSPHSRCFSGWRLRRLYGSRTNGPVATTVLAEIVTCPNCLDRVSDLLGFPGVSERHPADTLAPSAREHRRAGRRVRRTAVIGLLVVAASLSILLVRTQLVASAAELLRATGAAVVRLWHSGAGSRPRPSTALPVKPSPLFASPPPLPQNDAIARSVAVRANVIELTDAAAAELQVQALYLLDRGGMLLGRQYDLSRDGDGFVRLTTVARDRAEQEQVRRALAPIIRTPRFRLTIKDLAHLRARAQRVSGPESVIVRDLELTQELTPLMALVRQHVSETDVQRFANRVLKSSRQALLHSSVLQDLAARFGRSTLRANGAARATWETMLRYHALAVARETERLRADLVSLAPTSGLSNAASTNASTEGDRAVPTPLHATVSQLHTLASFHDDALGAALAASTGHGTGASVDAATLIRSLEAAERLAASIYR